NGTFTGQEQLGISYTRVFAAETERHRELEPELPFLEVAGGEIAIRAVELSEGAAFVARQVVAEAAPTVATDCIEPRHEPVLAGDELQLATANVPFLPAKFSTAHGRF